VGTPLSQAEKNVVGLEQLEPVGLSFQNLAEHLDAGVWLAALQKGRIEGCYVNPALEELCGRSLESLLRDPVSVAAAVHPEDRPRLSAVQERLLRGERLQEEFRLTRPDGEVRWLQLKSWGFLTAEDGRTLLAGAVTDVTPRRRAEAARQESEARRAAILGCPTMGMALVSPEGVLLESNRAFQNLLGQGGVIEAELRRLQETLLSRQEDFGQAERHYLSRDGQTMWARLNVTVIRDEEGEPLFSVHLVENLTGHRRTEGALKQSRERFRLLYDRAPLGYQSLDDLGHFIDINQTWLDILGYARNEVVGRWFGHFLTPAGKSRFENIFPDFKKHGEINDIELDMVRRDGSIIAVSVNGKIALDEQGGFKQAHCIFADVTARKRAEEALRQSEIKYRTLVEQIPAITYTARVDEFSTKLFISPQVEDLLGFSLAEYQADPDIWRRRLHPEDRDRVLAEIAQSQASGKTFASEYRMVTNDGRSVWFRDEARVVRDLDGPPLVVQGVILDITARKQAEADREKWERILSSTFHASHDLIMVLDQDLQVVMSNWRGHEASFERDEQRQFRHCYESFRQRKSPCDPCPALKVFASGATKALECADPESGRIREIRAFPILDECGQVLMVVAHVRDITERRRAEDALRESEQKYRLLVNTIPAVVFRGYADWTLDFFDDKIEELTGYAKEEFNSRRLRWCDVMVAEDLEAARQTFLEALRTTKSYVREYRIRDKAGKILWVHARSQIVCTPEGAVDYVSGVLFDITREKEMEQLLAAEKERLAVTLRSIGEGVIATDTQGHIVLMNGVAEELTGWTQQQVLGQPASRVFAIFHEESKNRCEDPVERVIQTREVVGLANGALLIARDGVARNLAASGAPIVDRDGQVVGVVLVFRDVTSKRQTEAELLKMEKLSSLAILAGGIAHDFNNILTGILGNISLAMLSVSKDDRAVVPRLAEAEQATLRARDLVQQLLTFAKGGAPVKELASLAEIIQESTTFTCRGSQVRAEFDLFPDLCPAEVDTGQISQVIQNLVINAVQAMPSGGALKVSAQNAALTAKSGLPVAAGRYIKICVQDQGMGIPEDHLAKIFDPYFSTKQKGSGLGLATAFSIITNHDGYMTVESSLGEGTAFYVYLPASQREGKPKRKTSPGILTGKGKILVMDDDDSVREVAGRILSHLGYQPDFARDGEEAIAAYARALAAGQPFAAVIMDLTIPGGMGGKEAIQKLRHIAPEARAIVSSGYADDPIMTHYKKYGFSGVIKKPYRVNAFGKELHRVLTRS
jgi:PAS domain S-box-containing protein